MVILEIGTKLEVIKEIPGTDNGIGKIAEVIEIDNDNKIISAKFNNGLMVMSFEECEEYFKIYKNQFKYYVRSGEEKNKIYNVEPDKNIKEHNFNYKNHKLSCEYTLENTKITLTLKSITDVLLFCLPSYYSVEVNCSDPNKFNLNKGLKYAEKKMIKKLIKDNVFERKCNY